MIKHLSHLLGRQVVVRTVVTGSEVAGYAIEVGEYHSGVTKNRQVTRWCPKWIVCAFLAKKCCQPNVESIGRIIECQPSTLITHQRHSFLQQCKLNNISQHLSKRSTGELGEGQDLETLGVNGGESPVPRPGFQLHTGVHSERSTTIPSSAARCRF